MLFAVTSAVEAAKFGEAVADGGEVAKDAFDGVFNDFIDFLFGGVAVDFDSDESVVKVFDDILSELFHFRKAIFSKLNGSTHSTRPGI